jgi:NAD+ diphosphatase
MPKSPIFSLTQPHPEASSLVAFSANDLDSRAEHRGPDCIEDALRTDGAHILAFAGDRLVLKHEDQLLDPLFAPYELKDLKPDFDNAVLIGFRPSGEPRLAVPVGIDPDIEHDHLKFADGRRLMRQNLVSESLLGEFAAAAGLLNWHRSSRFCGRCGGTTESQIGGFRRKCTLCAAEAFPRTDPVVIMLTIDEAGDRCLLGRSPHFPPGMYSCLAGFLEPGESIENAVRRETLEESGVKVGRVRYHASQPWPMPHSLMIGCYGEARSLAISRDTNELEDCAWFDRNEVEAMIAGNRADGKTVPVSGAVAFRLVRDWLDWPKP